jgi:hypothetical protein
MSETKIETTKDFEKALDEKIEKFINEVFHTAETRYWLIPLLHDLVRAEMAGRLGEYMRQINANLHNVSGESEFEFAGEEGECELARMGIPHAPHAVGSYMTVRYGSMDIYCLGRSGYLRLWGYTIHIDIQARRLKGGARGKVRVEVTA